MLPGSPCSCAPCCVIHSWTLGLGCGRWRWLHPGMSLARSMVWPTSPGAMACSWCVSCSLDAPAGQRHRQRDPACSSPVTKYCRMEVRAWWSCGAGLLVVVAESAKKPVEVGLGVAPVERGGGLLVAVLEG